MADAKFEVAGEKCDLRLQLRLPIVWWLGHPPCVSPRIFFWESFRLADAKIEVTGEKCDLRLQLRQKREESREKQEVAPKKLENTPWDILVGSLWWVFGVFPVFLMVSSGFLCSFLSALPLWRGLSGKGGT